MGEKIVIGPILKGLVNSVTPFNVDNDAFPVLINAYEWRGRIKRKRGTALLNRLRRFFNSTSTAYNSGSTTITLNGSGQGNLLTGFNLQVNGNIIPGTVTITAPGPTVYTDPAMDGTLSPSGTINYATGAITIAAEAGNAVSAAFSYYPNLPVMGLEELILNTTQFPGSLAYDTTYSYNIQTAFPYNIYNVSFYKNPAASASLPGYVPKTVWTPTSWNGQDYQQFWTTNYQGAHWATNGINIPFTISNVGMQFVGITAFAIVAVGPPATATITTNVNHGLVIGDFVFINEVAGITGVNLQTGYVIATPAANQIQVNFPNATLGGVYTTGGIVQYLTNRIDPTKDCLRWYDGDPTDGNVTTPGFVQGKGWVHFAPPLSEEAFSIADLPPRIYYLVGARMMLEFKDRLLFFGPVVQSSAGTDQTYLPDTIIYSLNGTPYYTASFTGNVTAATTVFNPILLPENQTAFPAAWWEDQTGFGGFITAGLQQKINTVSANKDALIVGFDSTETRLIYSGNDIVPFNFFIVNSELGSSSTFSVVNRDDGVITRGDRGFTITNQVQSDRIDLDIPDEVFQINLNDNGTERVTAQRDFLNEWLYMTYPSNNIPVVYRFPTQTLQYNYRENTWAIFREAYTTYGQFRKQTGFTWQTVGTVYNIWLQWNEPWNAGASTLLQPEVIAGNQQGFVVTRDDGTNESVSLQIRDITGNTVVGTTVESPDHCLNNGDFIIITGVIGTTGLVVNDQIFSVSEATVDTFKLNPSVTTGTYFGGGLITRMYKPFIQTRQFPTSWGIARKTRIGVQQYLFTTTEISQIQLLIFLSQNSDSAYNFGPIVPDALSVNDSLIYTTTLFTCPESTNLGLTPANINLNIPTAIQQSQTWHRMNTSLIGDTVQIGFTLSDDQMRAISENDVPVNAFAEIELHGFILDIQPSQLLV